ncbi:MAG: EAL domain-containing protein [Alphaproteobacteria bacterium]|nr:EAL domain-containing protein [Alphaproteobacteria bacterium]
MPDSYTLKCIEQLILKLRSVLENSETDDKKRNINYTLKCMASLARAVINQEPIFGIEPWHAINENVPLNCPSEFLLRLKGSKGEKLPPYPAIMTFYQNDMTTDIDTILFLCALNQFKNGDEKQISINVSAHSLRNADFIKTILNRIKKMTFTDDEQIIIEVHETSLELQMSKDVLSLFRKCGVMFAIDDTGLSIGDVMRLAEFENIADFIKLDHNSICLNSEKSNELKRIVSFITSMLPDAILIAEGVKNTEHAAQLQKKYPQIKYVQGMHLPKNHNKFIEDWKIQQHRKTALG